MKFILAVGLFCAVSQTNVKAQAIHGIRLGHPAPEIAFPSPQGDTLRLSDLRGNYVLLDFWASWCGPCRRKNPQFVELYRQFKNEKFDKGKHGFTFYSYSLDKSKESWVTAIQTDGLIWPNHTSDLLGWNAEAARKYGVNSIPRTFLLDPEGNIIMMNPPTEMVITFLQERLSQ